MPSTIYGGDGSAHLPLTSELPAGARRPAASQTRRIAAAIGAIAVFAILALVKHGLVHTAAEVATAPDTAAAVMIAPDTAAVMIAPGAIDFASLDANHNGLLRLQVQTDTSPVLANLDTNGDVLLSHAEFALADTNKDDILTEHEQAAIPLAAPGSSNSSADNACRDRYPAAKRRLETTIHTAMDALNGTDGMAAAATELLRAVGDAIGTLADKEKTLKNEIDALRVAEATMAGLRKDCTGKTHAWARVLNSTDCRHDTTTGPCFTNLHTASSEKMLVCDALANAVRTLEAAEEAVHIAE